MAEVREAAAVAIGPRLGNGAVGVIDVGSNSVRLVLYERASRAPAILFNEKVLAALGDNLAETGRLADEAMGRAYMAVRRFVTIARAASVADVTIVATAAARTASNGAAFIHDLEAISGLKVRVLDGREEAEMAARGVLCGFWRPDGVVGDLGGGSLELIDIADGRIGAGDSFPLGTLRLRGDSKASLSKAAGIAERLLTGAPQLAQMQGRTFYAVGGTWRSLVRLHMEITDYPLTIMHQYAVPGPQMAAFCDEVLKNGVDLMDKGGVVSRGRRDLVPFGAAVLRQVIRLGKPATVVASALGVREGMIFDSLDADQRTRDPLILAAEELAVLRSRSPQHSAEMVPWTEAVLAALGVEESVEEKRLRVAACLMSDIGWRAHPDYRADEALANITNVALYGVDHPGRGFLALVLHDRYGGPAQPVARPGPETLCSPKMRERAELLGLIFRVAYVMAPGIPGVLPRIWLGRENGDVVVRLPPDMAAFDGERPLRRVKQLARLFGAEGTIRAN